MSLAEKSIKDLVQANYEHASTLYYLGIKFYQYRENILIEVCRELGLDVVRVVANLEAKPHERANANLITYPVEVIVEYLKHAHNIFIKRRLPYIIGLVQGLDTGMAGYENPVQDLKFVFPHFVEDLIIHIYNEEDTLFRYILALEKARLRKFNPGRLFYEMEKNSIEEFALEHEAMDDEMISIRKITSDYLVDDQTDLHLKVIYAELQDFEKELITHAHIEDRILFPKALALEAQVKEIFNQIARNN